MLIFENYKLLSRDSDDNVNDGELVELVGGGWEVKQMASSTTSNRHFVRFTIVVLILALMMMVQI